MDRVLCELLRFLRLKILTAKAAKTSQSSQRNPTNRAGDCVACSIMRAPMKSRKAAKPHPMPVDALVYPRFSGVPTFMRLPYIPRAADLDLALIGVPFDGGTTYRPGARFGPRNIRVQSA